MSKGDKYAYYATMLIVVAVAVLILTAILGANFGAWIGIPLGITAVFIAMTSGILATKSAFQHDVERGHRRNGGFY